MCTSVYRLWVGQWPESIIVLLPSCVPQSQIHRFPIYHHICRIVVEAEERCNINICGKTGSESK
jgi:hypothetical protein